MKRYDTYGYTVMNCLHRTATALMLLANPGCSAVAVTPEKSTAVILAAHVGKALAEAKACGWTVAYISESKIKAKNRLLRLSKDSYDLDRAERALKHAEQSYNSTPINLSISACNAAHTVLDMLN